MASFYVPPADIPDIKIGAASLSFRLAAFRLAAIAPFGLKSSRKGNDDPLRLPLLSGAQALPVPL
jgi:hypothetical protein